MTQISNNNPSGWICFTQNIKHLSLQDKWDLLTKYSERFEWPPQTAPGASRSNVRDHADPIADIPITRCIISASVPE